MGKSKKEKLGLWMKLERKRLAFIQKDMEEFRLDENCTISIMGVDEIEANLGNEFPDYNVDITEVSSNKNNIVVISAYSPIKEKDVKLYYYENGEDLIRQLREYNYKEELKEIKRAVIYEDGRYVEVDEGSIQYAYDENGLKKYAKIDSSLVGKKYFVYDEDGKIEFEITNEYVWQIIKDGDKEYTIIDGYFKPTDNGFICLPSKTVEELNTEDVKRIVYGNISEEEKNSIIADLTEERKKQIINAIKLGPELEWITQEVELDYVGEYDEAEIKNPTPEEIVEQSIIESMEELRKSGRPYRFDQFIEDTRLEQHIGRAYGGDEFLSKLLEYAKRKTNLKEKNGQAKDLLNEYEQQINKDGQTQGDEN